MHKKRNQKEFIIHQVKGSRSPQPSRKFNKVESNDTEETESDEEYVPRRSIMTGLKDTKNLILEKVEDYALVNATKNICVEPNTTRLSSFIIKDEPNQKERFHPTLIKSPMNPIEDCKSPTISMNKYSMRYPNRQESCDMDMDEPIYFKKKIAVATDPNSSRLKYGQRPSNLSKHIFHHYLYKEEEQKKSDDPVEGSLPEDFELYNSQALRIQTLWRGYNLRLHLYDNLNIFYQTHKAVAIVEKVLNRKMKELLWLRLRYFYYYLKRIYIKNNLNLEKIPRMYQAANAHPSLRVFRKELNESFQFLRRKQGGKENTAVTYSTQQEQFVNYQEKLKTKVLRQLLILKLRKESLLLRNAFDRFTIAGMRASISQEKIEKRNLRKQQLLKHIVEGKFSKDAAQLKKHFLKLYFMGTLQTVRSQLLQSSQLITQANRSKVIIKVVLDKEKGDTANLRRSFKRFNTKVLTTKSNEEELALKSKKLHKLITSKGKNENMLLKQYFMKLYYNGLFKAMNCLPQKKMEDPALVLRRKLKKMVLAKESNDKKNLKQQFLKYYYRGIYKEFRSSKSNNAAKAKGLITIRTDSQMLGSIQTPKREAQTTKEKRMTMRQLIKAKKKGANDHLRSAFWKFFFCGVFRLLKINGLIEDRTNPKSPSKLPSITSRDSEVKRTKADVKALSPNKQEELIRRLSLLVMKKSKANDLRLEKAFTIYRLNCRQLKNQKMRISKMKSLVIKKDSDRHKALVNSFTKFNLKSKLLRIKGILRKNKRRKKKNAGQHSNTPSDVMPEEMPEMPEENDNDNLDDLLDHMDEDFEKVVSPSKPQGLRSKAKPKIREAPKEEEEEGTDPVISNDNMKQIIRKHIKLMNIIDTQNDNCLAKYFSLWRTPSKDQSLLRKSYKPNLFVKIITTVDSKITARHLKAGFNGFKRGMGFDIKKNVKAAVAISKFVKIIKKSTYQRYFFYQFFDKYIKYLQCSHLRRNINNMDMRIVRLSNKHMRNRFYVWMGKKPQLTFASSVISLMNSFQTVEDSFENLRNLRYKRQFYALLRRKAAWEKPINVKVTVRRTTYHLKTGEKVQLERNEKTLRNLLWKVQNPKKYYFKKFYATAVKMKEKELEALSRKWEYDDENTVGRLSKKKK